jgi:DnaK suppressor protein
MIDEIRQRLETQRAEIRERVEGLAAPPELGAAQGFGKRIGDGTVEAVRRLTDIGVGSSLEARLARIERALEKVANGTYGRCDSCGATIPAPRLRAMPESVLCVVCAGAERRARPRRR